MIQVELVFGMDGVLLSCDAQGHAGFAERGSDIVCAAVTVLVRTAITVLSDKPNISMTVQLPERGKLAFQVLDYDSSQKERLIIAGQFLKNGLMSVQKEYPQYVALRELTKEN